MDELAHCFKMCDHSSQCVPHCLETKHDLRYHTQRNMTLARPPGFQL